MKYPEFVSKYRPKGSVVKFNQGKYYVYKASSKRVPGKSYPVQVVEGMIGYIDEKGFHENEKTVVDTDSIVIRECGFTNFLLKYEEYFIAEYRYIFGKNRINNHFHKVYCSMIVYLSPNSYLSDDDMILPISKLSEEFNISVVVWIKKLEEMLEAKLEIFDWMKYICRVKIGNKVYKSDLTNEIINRLNELGLNENEIR